VKVVNCKTLFTPVLDHWICFIVAIVWAYVMHTCQLSSSRMRIFSEWTVGSPHPECQINYLITCVRQM